jgi:hypothetical protein
LACIVLHRDACSCKHGHRGGQHHYAAQACHYVRNTQKSPPAQLGDKYQQRIEPAGRYLLHTSEPSLAKGWENGTVRFKNPLVLYFNLGDGLYDEQSWKKQLERHYKKRGKALSRAIVADGYDGVITVDKAARDTREIVDLTWLVS